MAAEMPRPGRSDGPGPGVYDHTLWMLLRGVVAHRPVLPVPLGVGARNSPRVAERRIRATVSAVLSFGDKVNGLLALPDAPGGVGSARAVASVVVRMCWEFAWRWSCDRAVTSGLMADFEREVDVVDGALDMIATRLVT